MCRRCALTLSALAVFLSGCGDSQRPVESSNRATEASRPAEPVLHSSIDTPAPNSRIGKRLTVAGWAFVSGGAVQQISVLLDGSRVAVAAYGGTRPDVQKQFNEPASLQSGWYTEIDGSKITPGQHTVSVVATLQGGPEKTLGEVAVTK